MGISRFLIVKWNITMSDVYLIYAREDYEASEKIYSVLNSIWDVWWDDKIVGQFSKIIETELSKAKCIVVICSKYTNKPAVIDELTRGERETENIIPLLMDGTLPPYPFAGYSNIDFTQWKGNQDFQGLITLQRRIQAVVPSRQAPPRPLFIGNHRLPNPTIFMSVSSHETQLDVPEALTLLKAASFPAILVSAYDIYHCKKEIRESIISLIKEYREQGGFVLIDSGDYEAKRLTDKKKWHPNCLKYVLKNVPHDWAFCFDVLDCSDDIDEAVNQIVTSVSRDSKVNGGPVLPIIHVSTYDDDSGIKRLPEIVRKVSEKLSPQIIAIPERELGDGMKTRTDTMRAIRQELNKLPYYQPIHLLGTGNPWSISVLAASGADTFDGLEWCRYAIDHQTDTLHHFQNGEFFNDFSLQGEMPYTGQVLLSNLKYYLEFSSIMQSSFFDGEHLSFVIGVTKMKNLSVLKQRFPGVVSK